MAKVVLVKNIFNPSDCSEPDEIKGGMLVRDYIKSKGIDTEIYESECECYDPETDSWTVMAVSDNEDAPLNVSIIVNGDEQTLDYEIKDNDIIAITILPAGNDSMSFAATMFSVAAGIFAAVGIGLGTAGVGWIAASVVCTILSATLGLAAAQESASNRKQRQDDEGEQSPSVVGVQNQALTGNPFPAVLGSLEVTPYVIGSPYNELLIKVDENGVPVKATRYGIKQNQTTLLCIGYGPLYVNDIKLNNMPLSTNPNRILSGILSHEIGSGDTFEGKPMSSEIAASYRANRFRMEISQFGKHRTIYPYSIKQKNMDVALLYCYDNKYEAIATEHQISWQGATFPTGMRSNSVYFSEAMPHKIAVGIEFPKGLYKEYTDDNGNFVYNKIPMHLVIQWRPVYRYTEEMDELNGNDDFKEAENVYKYERDGYGLKRYGAWRNFDNTKDKYQDDDGYWHDKETGRFVEKVPSIVYSSGQEVRSYRYTDDDGNYFYDGGGFYYNYSSSVNVDSSGNPIWSKVYYAKKYDNRRDFEWARYDVHASAIKKTYTICNDRYVSCYARGSFQYQNTDTGRYMTENEFYSIVSSQTNADMKYFENQGALYGGKNKDVTIEASENTPSAREVALNYGLSTGTSVNSNPNWNGVECFSFGEYSCGPKAVSGDPGQGSVSSMNNLEDAKDSMTFEISATLSQEDILDLINKNPETNSEGNSLTNGKAKVVTDCIEIRVIRLTPCYIDKLRDKKQHTYSDIVKWTYIKTYGVNKTKLQNDCDTRINEEEDFTKINCALDGSKAEGYSNYKDWNVKDYYSKPLDDEDQRKMVTLAVECEPDKLGYIKDTLKKISVRASAITPALKTNYIRYWRTVSGKHYYYDSYDTEDTMEVSNIPEMSIHWILDDKNIYSDSFESIGDYKYQVRDKEWEHSFFPKAILQKTLIQPMMSVIKNEAEYNDKGEMLFDTVKFGNTWFDYIEAEMSKHKSDDGTKWIAKPYFLDTFTKQNAIAQVLGFMCGKSLGKEAKIYNSYPKDHNIRLWYVKDDRYWYYDTEFIEQPSIWYELPVTPTLEERGVWEETTKNYYDTFEIEGDVSNGITWCWNEMKSSYNMLALREAYTYTDTIDFGGAAGPIKWEYNLYLTSQKKLSDVFRDILVGALSYWYYDDKGRYEIHNDKPRKNPVLLITDEDCISSSNTREFKKSIGGYHITFKDEDNGGRPGEIYVLRADQDLARPTRDILELSLNGITKASQAWAYGSYMMGLSITQRESWTRKLNHIGHSLKVGSLVEVQGSTLMIGTDHSGRIQKLIEDDKFVYGFIIDGMYNYRAEYDEEGRNIQGCTLMQSSAELKSRIVTLNFATKKQQKDGISVVMDDRTITFKNNKGDTNLVLFEKKIVKDKKALESLTGKDISPTVFDPHPGDVVAFGNVGSITSKAVVYELSYDNKGKISVSLYPYFESVYRSGDTLPVYQTNLTRKERNGNIPVDEAFIDLGMNDYINRKQLSEALSVIESGNDKLPTLPAVKYCKADRDGIEIMLVPKVTGKLSDQIKIVKYKITRPNGTVVEAEGTTEYKYEFGRKASEDGYPEKDKVDEYRIEFSVINIYGKESDISSPIRPDTDGYGTWKVPKPIVLPRVSDRTVTLVMSLPSTSVQVYGDIRYRVSIKRPDKDTDWYKPDLITSPFDYKDPASKENVYKIPNSVDGYETVNNVYIHTLPLKVNEDGKGMFDTLYHFKVTTANEVSVSEWEEEDVVPATALATSIVDIVETNKTAESEYVKYLSAISANVGVIKQGSLTNDDNYWALSDIPAEVGGREFKKGQFRVGGEDQYIEYDPDEGKMNIKANLDVDADFANIRGELAVYPVKVVYKKTEDTDVIPGKTYYLFDEETGEYVKVENPVREDLDDYYDEDTSKKVPAFQVKPSEVDASKNMTVVNGTFRAKNESVFGNSTVDLSFIRQFLEIGEEVQITLVR